MSNNDIIPSDNVIFPGKPVPSEHPQRPAKTNALAVVAAVCAALGFLTAVGFVAGVVCGHLALAQIKRSNGLESGRGLAKAAVIISWAPIIAVTLVFGMLFIVGLASAGGS